MINCDAPRHTEKFVFVTHLPCAACAKRLIYMGNVVRVIYKHDYRNRDSLDLLKLVGIEVRQFKEEP